MIKERAVQKEWPTAGGNIARTGVSQASILPPLKLKWTFDTCSSICCGFISGSGIAVFGDCHGKGRKYWLIAVEVISGKELWRYELNGMVFGTPTIVDDRVFVGNGYAVTCLNLVNGQRIWYSETGRSNEDPRQGLIGCNSCSLHLDDHLFLTDNLLVAFRVEDGKIVYKTTISHDTETHTGPCADWRFVYFPYSSMEILRMNRLTGKFDSSIRTDGKVCSGPVVAGSTLIYGTNRKTLKAVDLETLSHCWDWQFSGDEWFVRSRPAVSKGRVFLGGPDGAFYCMDLNNGKLIWKVADLGDIDSPPIVCDDKVFQFTSTGCFLLSTDDGKILWHHKIGKWNPATSAPAFVDGLLLIGWDKLYAFRGAK